jgi:hypothetical protein
MPFLSFDELREARRACAAAKAQEFVNRLLTHTLSGALTWKQIPSSHLDCTSAQGTGFVREAVVEDISVIVDVTKEKWTISPGSRPIYGDENPGAAEVFQKLWEAIEKVVTPLLDQEPR